MKLLIKGGRVIDPVQKIDQQLDIRVVKGKITEIGRNLEAQDDRVVDASGCIVTPGLIDMHVHLREPGFEAKETIASGTRAAAAGGFTAVACMPNTNPVADNRSTVEYIKIRARETGVVKVYPIGSITRGSLGEELTEIADLAEAGAVALSDDGRPVANAGLMRRAMEYARMFNLPVISHCEDLNLRGAGVMNEGWVSACLGLHGIPAAAEEIMVARDLILAELTGARLHIAHVSTAGSVRLIREAKSRGVRVTAEATPHHFTLTDEAVQGYDTATKVNPPLRTAADVEAIIEGLQDGTIDVIATDHAPHTREEKDCEYDYAPFGMVGLETAVPLVVSKLILAGKLDWLQAVAKLSSVPARILGLPGGSLKTGSPADITIIDPQKEKRVDVNCFYSKGRNSPFHGWKLKGWPVVTIVEGTVVMEQGKVIAGGGEL
ncbi:dihydroorotase [Calderihabitans maritimus]|uniref:Dihydroorotase n=1 Tax=Calderihabitans maritimus TaxID=1246530 RepID=A0A1Z5HSX4_9FIRM|nr:dihydroorotase [Calderihabitans maritimus]GAW92636.1 dihydroorotase and related cyclic amidohydrolases [Calderihabitans maritimus]